ncbi:MAG: OsmC family protein [Cycloclasticus sp.]
MQDLPHHYKVVGTAGPDGDVSLSTDKVKSISSAPPAEFDGPGDRWSPETLLLAAIADCFALTFRPIARASKFSWLSLKCEVEGTLELKEGKMKFTHFAINATLDVPQDANEEKAYRLLEKAEASCLVTNSLSGDTLLKSVVVTVGK